MHIFKVKDRMWYRWQESSGFTYVLPEVTHPVYFQAALAFLRRGDVAAAGSQSNTTTYACTDAIVLAEADPFLPVPTIHAHPVTSLAAKYPYLSNMRTVKHFPGLSSRLTASIPREGNTYTRMRSFSHECYGRQRRENLIQLVPYHDYDFSDRDRLRRQETVHSGVTGIHMQTVNAITQVKDADFRSPHSYNYGPQTWVHSMPEERGYVDIEAVCHMISTQDWHGLNGLHALHGVHAFEDDDHE